MRWRLIINNPAWIVSLQISLLHKWQVSVTGIWVVTGMESSRCLGWVVGWRRGHHFNWLRVGTPGLPSLRTAGTSPSRWLFSTPSSAFSLLLFQAKSVSLHWSQLVSLLPPSNRLWGQCVLPIKKHRSMYGWGVCCYPLQYSWVSFVAQLMKNPPAMQETWVQSLGWLVGKIPWRRERLPTPVFWPREFHGLYSLRGLKESEMTEQLSLSLWNYHNIVFFLTTLLIVYTPTYDKEFKKKT